MKKLLVTLLSVLMCLTVVVAPVAAEENEYKTCADAINEPDWYPGKYTFKNISKVLSGLAEVPDNIKNQREANKEFIATIKETIEDARQLRKDALSAWYYGEATPADTVEEIELSYVAEGGLIGLNLFGIVSWSRSIGDAVRKLLD